MKKRKTKDATDEPQAAPDSDKEETKRPSLEFPVVAIGGSAGSLDAIESLVRNLPPRSGMSFVIITHLDPSGHSLLAELISRVTEMDVVPMNENRKIDPNSIYVIAPGKYMAIKDGALEVYGRFEERGVPMPIDFFLRSLADEQGTNAAAVILSGTGSDGTLGLRAVQARLGLVIAQDPTTAAYDGMPKSAISTGLVDMVLPPEKIPSALIEYFDTIHKKGIDELQSVQEADVTPRILSLLRYRTGNDFAQYKKNSINRRIERRLTVHQLKDKRDYLEYLRQHPPEIDFLFKELLIEVTHFFRDPEAFEILKDRIAKDILSQKDDGDQLRVWVPACSTGEEAYSIAMLLKEALEASGKLITVQVFATDIDDGAIEAARQATYPASIAQDVSKERLERFFIKEEDRYRIKKEIREMVVFATQNLLSDPPFIHLNIISCRNLLIYLEPPAQRKIIDTFSYSLEPEGLLFLGPSETIDGFTDRFSAIDSHWKLYSRKDYDPGAHNVVESFQLGPPKQFGEVPNEVLRQKGESVKEAAESTLLEDFTYPAIVVSPRGDILYFHGKTGEFLQPTAGKSTLTVEGLVRADLKLPIGVALREAIDSRKQVKRTVHLFANGGTKTVEVVLKPLRNYDKDGRILIVFKTLPTPEGASPDVAKSAEHDKESYISEVESELASTKETLQSMIEQLETYNEELRSANEELQSTNEELQSTNEETETAKEELQSMNEELMSVNSELEMKNKELIDVNSDMRNILNSTQVATIFLDRKMKIKRFTPQMQKIMNLIPADIGRPISDISLKLRQHNMEKDAEEVLETLKVKESLVQTNDGDTYSMMIAPYKSVDNVIDGVVIVFVDITSQIMVQDELKKLREKADAERDFAQKIIEGTNDPLVVLDLDLKVLSANKAFYDLFEVKKDGTQDVNLRDLGTGQWNISDLLDLLEKVAKKGKVIHDFEVEADFPGIGPRKMVLNARRVDLHGAENDRILLTFTDATGKEYRDAKEAGAEQPSDPAEK